MTTYDAISWGKEEGRNTEGRIIGKGFRRQDGSIDISLNLLPFNGKLKLRPTPSEDSKQTQKGGEK